MSQRQSPKIKIKFFKLHRHCILLDAERPDSASARCGGTFALTLLRGPLDVVQHAVVVHPAQHLLLHQGEFLPGGQLPLAGEAGEAGQVVHVALRPAHPVGGVDVAAAAGAPRPISSVWRIISNLRKFGKFVSVYLLLKHQGWVFFLNVYKGWPYYWKASKVA